MAEIEIIQKDRQVRCSNEDDVWPGETVRTFGWRLQRRSPQWRPPTDVYETEKEFVVVVEIAGMRGADISAIYDKGLLSIRGIRSDRGVPKAYHQMEIAYGEFLTEIKLPNRIDTENIEATYSDGFLRVILPEMGSKQISVGDAVRTEED